MNSRVGFARSNIRKIDIFGDKFTFSSFGKSHFKTTFGGLATLIIVVTTIVIGLLWGQDFYQRKNPYAVTKQVIKDSYEFINLTNSNFTLAFRFENSNGVPYSEDDVRIKGYYQNNNVFNNVSLVKCMSILNTTSDAFKSQKINFEDWFCTNYTSDVKELGGDYSSTYGVMFFDFEVKATSLHKISEYQLISSILVPKYTYNTDNLDDPLGIKYYGISRSLDPSTRRFNNYKFSKLELLDDQDMIFSNEKISSVIGLYSADIDLLILTDFKKEFIEVCTMSIYYLTDYSQNIRKFEKIQNVLAQVGGFIQIIFYVLMFLVMPYNRYKMETSFINHFFSFGAPESQGISKKYQLVNSNQNALIKLKRSYIKSKINNKTTNILKNIIPANLLHQEASKMKEITQIKEHDKECSKITNKETGSNLIGLKQFSNLSFSVNQECPIYMGESGNRSTKKLVPMFDEDLKRRGKSCEASQNSKEPSKTSDMVDANMPRKKLIDTINQDNTEKPKKKMKLGGLFKRNNKKEVSVEGKNSTAESGNKKENTRITYKAKASSASVYDNEKLPDDRKFDFFYTHLSSLTQKKKSGFNIDTSVAPIEELQDYVKKNSVNKQFTISFFQYFKSLICQNWFPNKQLELTSAIVNQKLDISSYLKLVLDVQNLKKILLNYYQSLALNYQAKPNFFNIDEIPLDANVDKVSGNIQETVSYFINKDQYEEMSAIDYVCIQDLELPLKRYIFDKCPDIKMLYAD